MSRNLSFVSWILLIVSVCAWGAVVYAGSHILDSSIERGAAASNADQQADRVAYALRVHALAEDSAKDRASMESLMSTDIVTIAKQIEDTGRSANVNASVSSANPETGAKELPGGAPLRAVSFVVQLQGSYSALLHAAKLFETFPIPSQIQDIELERISQGDAATQSWHMTLRLRVLTTSDITL